MTADDYRLLALAVGVDSHPEPVRAAVADYLRSLGSDYAAGLADCLLSDHPRAVPARRDWN